MLRRPPRSTLFPTRRSSDLGGPGVVRPAPAGRRGVSRVGVVGSRHYPDLERVDRKSTRLNSSHLGISYAVFCLKKKEKARRLAAKDASDLKLAHSDKKLKEC